MALLDLSLVTQTLVTVLESRLPTFPDWPLATSLTVSPAPPDSVNANHAISFYLYHMRETAHTKAQDWQSNDDVPQRYKSMGLTLYYIMTPRSDITDLEDRAYADQLTIGLAIKTLHEVPLITDTTSVESTGGPVIVMPLAMRGLDNKLRITYRPTQADDAAEYWQAGTLSARLSAYYEVDAVLLTPEMPQTSSGRVYSVGVHSFTRPQPQLVESISERTLDIPGEPNPVNIKYKPAQAGIGEQVTFKGSNLKGDQDSNIVLIHRDFVEPLALDASWNLQTDGVSTTVTVQALASGQTLVPGIFGAMARTTDRRQLPDGRTRDFIRISNQITFAITPSIVSITQVAGEFTIKVEGFEPHLLANDEVLLFAGMKRITRSVANPPAAGEFVTPNTPAADTDSIVFSLPAGVVAGEELIIKLVVRGAESAPHWVVAA